MSIRSLLPLFVVCLPLSAAAQLQPRRDFVLTEKDAVAIFPPETVCDGTAKEASWSPSGRYLLVSRLNEKLTPELMKFAMGGNRVDPGEHQLVLWSARTHQAKVIWTLKAELGHIVDVQWMAGADTAFVTVDRLTPVGNNQAEDDRSLLLVSAGSGQVRTIAHSSSQILMLELSPTQPVGMLIYRNPEAPNDMSYQTLSASGLSSNPASLHVDRYMGIMWGADGKSIFLPQRTATVPGQRGQIIWSQLDPATARISPVTEPRLWKYQGPAPAEVYPSDGRQAIVKESVSVDVQTLWLSSAFKSEFQHALLGADTSAVEISPTGDAVYYRSQGIGYVRSLMRMPKEQFQKMLAAADRALTMSNTKQAVTALMMYGADNDDKWPLKEEDILSVLYPYTKNGDVLKNFVYTFAGGDISKVENPAQTEVGYTEGPGGRAVAYADGHVIWKPGA